MQLQSFGNNTSEGHQFLSQEIPTFAAIIFEMTPILEATVSRSRMKREGQEDHFSIELSCDPIVRWLPMIRVAGDRSAIARKALREH